VKLTETTSAVADVASTSIKAAEIVIKHEGEQKVKKFFELADEANAAVKWIVRMMRTEWQSWKHIRHEHGQERQRIKWRTGNLRSAQAALERQRTMKIRLGYPPYLATIKPL
jgi:hypothetical protein